MKVKIEEVKELCRNIAMQFGFSIYDVQFKQGKNPALTIFIDKKGGITLDDCEVFNNAIDAPIDELDPTYGEAYTLNVSSPGADRPFRTAEEFENHIGKMVEVKLTSAIKGKKFYEGILKKYDGERVVIESDKATLSFELKNVVKVSEYIEF